MTYQIQKHGALIGPHASAKTTYKGNCIYLVEQRNDDISPVILDTDEKDHSILDLMIGEIIEEDDFEIKELEIEGYPGNFHTIACLLIDDVTRAKLS